MYSPKLLVAALAATTLACSAAQAAPVLDQNSAPFGGSLYEALEWQQQVTAGVAGQLSGITLYGGGTNVLVRLAQGDGFYSGPYAFSQAAVLAGGGTFIDTSAANIMLTAGQHFVIDLSQGFGGNISTAASPYPGGHLFLNFGVPSDYTNCCNISLAFQTFMEVRAPDPDADPNPAAVPEPSVWAMMLMGFGALGAAMRRQRRRALTA